jgi:hypothetical protein
MLNIESVNEFKYLGIVFSTNGSFCKAIKYLAEQAQKAMYGVITKIRQSNLQIEQQFDLFDKEVKPVLLYGCQIWDNENLDIIERVRLKFLKYILCMKSSALVVYGLRRIRSFSSVYYYTFKNGFILRKNVTRSRI